jgi:signal transduction histidine kinase
MTPVMTASSKAISAFALIILLSIGVLSFHSFVQDEQERGWVTHTHLVIEELQAVLIDIGQAETGQRGYMLTGQDNYLDPYRAGCRQVRQHIEKLRELTADSAMQQETIRHLKPLVEARLAGLEERIEIRRRSGLAAGAEAVATGDGEGTTDAIRAEISGMRGREEQLLSLRMSTAAASNGKIKVVIILGNALAILILLAAGFAIHRETGRRNRAEEGLKYANRDLEERKLELSEANSELESFSYSVAHDLRAPLRQIGGYSNVLLQDYGPSLDVEAQRHLEKLAAGASKMGRLLDDLLSFSRLGRQELLLQATPLDLLLRQVIEELGPECSGRDIEWRIGDLFTTECDPALMKQVFVNLLSNAVKYSGKREHAVIEVGQMLRGEERVIFVRDNGAGFEMQYVGKLFGVFQRLHKTREFEGTGVGLAIVQRIIRKHGGRIWAEAKLDEGATFFFTLGSAENNSGEKPELPIEHEVINVA